MTPEIKKRIEQIQRGEVPEGYKRTKVGIVPYEWSCAKMSDMFDRLNRKNKVGNTNVLTISAQHGLISQEKFFNKSVASEDKSNYFLLKQGNFAYNKSYSNGYPFGAIKCLTAYDSGIVSPLYICFEPAKGNQCPEYFAQYFDGGFLNREIHAVAQEGARNHGLLNIGVDDFFSLNITVPPLAEQKKIAEILAAQDKVIELYQRKIDEIKKLKKICLSKMFPQKGHNAPEIRFPEFTDAWEQRKLGDIAPLRGGFAFKSEEYTDTGVPIIRISNILSNGTVGAEFVYYAEQADDEVYALYDGSALLAMSGATTGKVSVLHAENTDKFYQNQRVGYFTRQKGYDYKFVSTIVRSSLFSNQLGVVLAAGAQPNVSAKDIDSFEFMVPPQTKEQAAIGEFFGKLDNLITLHQRKLEELQKSKKALMQLLLTGIVRVKL